MDFPQRPSLYLDIGNTRAKLARPVNGDGWELVEAVPSRAEAVLEVVREAADRTPSSPPVVAVCCVVPAMRSALEAADAPPGMLRWFDSRHIPPDRTRYAPSHALGPDRFLIAMGAWAASGGGRPVVALGAGTALTFDLVDSEGVHLGGAILPGIETLRRGVSLALPALVSPPFERPGPWPATSTQQALEWGQAGMVGLALESLLTRSFHHFSATEADRNGPPPEVWVTGGDARRLLDAVPALGQARMDPHLLFSGLRRLIG